MFNFTAKNAGIFGRGKRKMGKFWDFLKKQRGEVPYAHNSIANGSTPFEREVVLFEDRKQHYKASKNGLYPPEIILLFFADSHPNPKTGYPSYYWYKYGVRDVDALKKSLEERGFISRGSDGVCHTTKLGELELKDNEFITWAHRKGANIAGIDAWSILNIINNAPEKIAKFPWRDKVWAYINKYRIRHFNDQGLYRNMTHEMARFLADEGKYEEAIKFLKEVVQLDRDDPSMRGVTTSIPRTIEKYKRKLENSSVTKGSVKK